MVAKTSEMSSSSTPRVMNVAVIPRKEVILKILVVGAYGVGKTSIVHRYVEDKFFSAYRSTIGIDFHRKTLLWTPNCIIHVQLWDVAGNEKFRCVTNAYYRNAHGVAIVCDVTKPETLEVAQLWLEEIRNLTGNSDGSRLPVVLMANKGDLQPCLISNEAIVKFCEANKVFAWCSTSAKLDYNIDKAFGYLIEESLAVACEQNIVEEDSIKLNLRKLEKKKNCCSTG